MKKGLLVVFVFMSVLSSSVMSMEPAWNSEKNMDRFRAVFFSEDVPFSAARKLIEKQNFNINQPINEHGDRLLHEISGRAVLWNQQNLERFTFLLEHGANLDLRNDENKTPFDLVRMENYTIFTNWFAKLGYTAFPCSLPLKKNPLHLLRNGASLYKKLYAQSAGTDDVEPATDGAMEATNILADLFMFIKNNENNRLNGQWQWLNHHCEYHPGITVSAKGYFLKNTTFEDLIQHVGKEGVDFVAEVLAGMCEKTDQEKDMDVVREIETMYPFVKIYRAQRIEESRNSTDIDSFDSKDYVSEPYAFSAKNSEYHIDMVTRAQLMSNFGRHVRNKDLQAIKQFIDGYPRLGYTNLFWDFKRFFSSNDDYRTTYNQFDCFAYCMEWNNIEYDTTMPQELSAKLVRDAENSSGEARCDAERQMLHFLFGQLRKNSKKNVTAFIKKYAWLNYKPLYRWMKDCYPQKVADPLHIFHQCVVDLRFYGGVRNGEEYDYSISNMSQVD